MKTEPDTPLRTLCAIVPAAGRGTRLGVDVPKVFVPLLPGLTLWDAIHRKLSPLADHLVLVLSPDGQNYLNQKPSPLPIASLVKTDLGLQSVPLGMGDAIFGVSNLWQDYDDLLIVWGDQFNLSTTTLEACLRLHANSAEPSLTLPVVRMVEPYVEYVFDSNECLTQIRQSREGDHCEPNGLSDIGVFLLSGGGALIEEWNRYRAGCATGARTGEINFLPFLIHLSAKAGWPVHRHETPDPAEAIGINTPMDLTFARQLLQKSPAP